MNKEERDKVLIVNVNQIMKLIWDYTPESNDVEHYITYHADTVPELLRRYAQAIERVKEFCSERTNKYWFCDDCSNFFGAGECQDCKDYKASRSEEKPQPRNMILISGMPYTYLLKELIHITSLKMMNSGVIFKLTMRAVHNIQKHV